MNSVLGQTFTDYDVWVVDDGSTDDTRSALASLIAPQLNYLHQPNRGVASARNTGIQHARGKYIAFLDSDDCWYPTKLAQVLVRARKRPEVGLFCSNMVIVNERGARLRVPRLRAVAEGYPRLLEGNFVFTSTVVVKRECLERVGAFDPALVPCEDWDLWIRIARKYPLMQIPEVLVTYERSAADSLSSRYERWAAAHDAVMGKSLAADPTLSRGWIKRIRAGVYHAKGSIYLGAGEERLALEQFKLAFRQSFRRWRALVYVVVLSWTALRYSLPHWAKVMLGLPETRR